MFIAHLAGSMDFNTRQTMKIGCESNKYINNICDMFQNYISIGLPGK